MSMGHDALLRDLREKGDAQIRTIWQTAEAEAAKHRNEIEAALAAEESKFSEQEHRLWKELRATILMEAHKKADQIVILAQQELADRLYELARQALTELRDSNYEDFFARLVQELPAEQWKEVRVNPQDASLAGKSFPTARVTNDDSITGGLAALTSDGLEVINTLDKRLERAWESMLPGLLANFRNKETAA